VGREVDGRADVYSLAAVIFEAVTGRRPFSSKSWIETLSRRLYEPPPSVRDLVPDLPAAFATTLQQAMDREPSRRPASAAALLDGLESALKGPGRSIAAMQWVRPMVSRGDVGLSAIVVVVIGVAEAAWLFEGSGLSLLMRFIHSVLGH
jgi:serine/threonine protein kinase